jgi:hypothetical protein
MKPQASRGWITAASLALLALPAWGPAWGEAQPLGREVRVNGRTDFKQQNPVAAVAPSGRSLVVWENDQRGLRGQFFTAAGIPSGAELTLAESDALTAPEQRIAARRDPSVAFLPGGGFALAWTEEVADVRSFAYVETRNIVDQDIYLQRFDAAGLPASLRVRLNSTTAGFQRQPRIISRGGNLLVTWESADGGIYVRSLSSNGGPVGPEIRINSAAGSQPVGATGATSSLIAWEAADGSEVGVFARILGESGQPVGPVFRVSTDTAGRQRRPTVAAGTDGNFLVAWQGDLAITTQSRVFAQAVGANGNLMGPQLTLVRGVGYDVAHIAPALAAAPNGHFLLSWLGWPKENSNDFGMAAAEIDSLGNTIGTPARVSEIRVQRNFRRTSIATNGAGRYLLAWETVAANRQSITARRIGAN